MFAAETLRLQLADLVLVTSPRPAAIPGNRGCRSSAPDLDLHGYLEKGDRNFRIMGMSPRARETAA